jgi:hypothetical protein
MAVAQNGRREIVIEAKAETSSMSHTRRFGKCFNSGQVGDHVAKALYCAARDTSLEMLAGVAFPKNAAHVKCVEKILPVLKRLRIEVFRVLPNRSAEVERVWRNWGRASGSRQSIRRTPSLRHRNAKLRT